MTRSNLIRPELVRAECSMRGCLSQVKCLYLTEKYLRHLFVLGDIHRPGM